MNQLIPCPACRRHVRKTEPRCPFCAEALSFEQLPPARLPARRLGRAATFAFGASVAGATAVVACEDVTVLPPYGSPPIHAGQSQGGSSVSGSPPVAGSQSQGGIGGTGPAVDDGGAIALYGGAPSAGTDNAGGAGVGGDGSVNAGGEGGAGTTIYGGPPAGAGGA